MPRKLLLNMCQSSNSDHSGVRLSKDFYSSNIFCLFVFSAMFIAYIIIKPKKSIKYLKKPVESAEIAVDQLREEQMRMVGQGRRDVRMRASAGWQWAFQQGRRMGVLMWDGFDHHNRPNQHPALISCKCICKNSNYALTVS